LLKITLERVTKSYGKVKAVDGLSLEIKKGEAVGLVGESGCGKSTVASILADLIRPDAGQCLFAGKKLAELNRQEYLNYRRNVQMVFQDFSSALNPRMSAGESIAEPIRNFRRPGKKNEIEEKHRVENLLRQLGLTPEDARRYPRTFSGGQRQRICIARAIAAEPSFLLLDEVTSSMDVSTQAQILNLLTDLRKSQGMGILFISHDIGVVRYICDKILVMYQGSIVEELDSENLSAARHDYSRQLLAAVPSILEY